MTLIQDLASFVVNASFEVLSQQAREQLKLRVLDSLGCAIGALDGDPVKMVRQQINDFGGSQHCTLIGGGKTAPDRAALYNGLLVRYLDFNDTYPAKNETCHPSDNVAPVLAACEYADATGKDFLTALAVAYQVQCRLSDLAPVRSKGFDHTTQGAYAVAAGVSKGLGLDVHKTANAVALCGTSFNALRVTRTGSLSHLKGLAYPTTSFACTNASFLAMRGITGPAEVLEGNKGFMDSIAGRFAINWSKEDLEKVTETYIKKYNAEWHSQAALEGLLELKAQHGFHPSDIARVAIEIFDVAYNIIGGGEEGEKVNIRTKEEADHSLPYMAAVALLDGQVMPEQYLPQRILKDDVQALLQKVTVNPRDDYSQRFPREMPCSLRVTLNNGQAFTREKTGYQGFRTHPISWETVQSKFDQLAAPRIDSSLRSAICQAVKDLETIKVKDFCALLRQNTN